MDALDHIDFPFDANASGEFFHAVDSLDSERANFRAAVPPHIRPEAIAHWDAGELY